MKDRHEAALPVIDLSAIRRRDPLELQRLRSALHDSGSAYLAGHDFPTDPGDRMSAMARAFLSQSLGLPEGAVVSLVQ